LYYFKTFFYPMVLAIDQQWVVRSLTYSTFYLPLVIIVSIFVSIGVLFFYIYKYYNHAIKYFTFFLGWFIVGLLFHLQIFPLDKTVADRWFYFPMVGLLGMIGVVVEQLILKKYKYTSIFAFLSILIICILSTRTILRNNNWKDAITLYSHDIQYSDNFDVENNLGVEYENKLEFSKAIPHFEKSVIFRPFEYNLVNLGISYAEIGKIKEAKSSFSKAYNLNTFNMFSPHKHALKLYRSYATTLIFYDSESAIPVIQNGLRDYPDDVGLWFLLALSYDKAHDKQNALIAAKKAYQLEPSDQNKYIYNHLKNTIPISIDYKSFGGKVIKFESK